MKQNDIVLLVNIVTLYALYRLGAGSAFGVLPARIFLNVINSFGILAKSLKMWYIFYKNRKEENYATGID